MSDDQARDEEQARREAEVASAEDAAPCEGCDRDCPHQEDAPVAEDRQQPEEARQTEEEPAAQGEAEERGTAGEREEQPKKPAPPELEVGVSFPHNPKVYSFASGGLRLSIGDRVLVRTDKGVDLGEVVRIKGRIPPERAEELTPVVRRASADDLAHVTEQEERERRALEICEEKITEHDLPMKLIDAHMSFDNTRLVFLFTAEGRVDFRELVRDLAKTFKMRIELRQVGVRDEAKLLGGLGPCGRQLCCKMFMRNFEPVGIRIAKDQGLALNPAKLSGLCDRLMCCLRFEHETYLQHRDELPDKGERVQVGEVVGEVSEVHLLTRKLTVRSGDGREVTVAAADARVLEEGERPEPPPPREEEPPRERPDGVRTRDKSRSGERDRSREQKAEHSEDGSRRRRRKPRSRRKKGGGDGRSGEQVRQQPSSESKTGEAGGQSGGGSRSRRSRGRRRRSKSSRSGGDGGGGGSGSRTGRGGSKRKR